MTQIEILGISGATYPLNIYGCDVYQNQCVLIATLYSSPVSTLTITLPPQFDSSPAVGILIKDSSKTLEEIKGGWKVFIAIATIISGVISWMVTHWLGK